MFEQHSSHSGAIYLHMHIQVVQHIPFMPIHGYADMSYRLATTQLLVVDHTVSLLMVDTITCHPWLGG